MLRIDYGNWGWWVLCKEKVLPLVHPAHINFRHGVVGRTAATVRVAHSFEVVTQAKVAAVIGLGVSYPLVGCRIDFVADT